MFGAQTIHQLILGIKELAANAIQSLIFFL